LSSFIRARDRRGFHILDHAFSRDCTLVAGRDGFEDSIFEAKAKASSLRGQGQGQFSLRPRPVLFEAKAKASV